MRSRRTHEGYLASASDAMAGLVFVFVMLIIVMSMSFNDKMSKYEKITEYQYENKQIRDSLLNQISRALSKRGINIFVDYEDGILRLNNESLMFDVGEYKLDDQYQNNLVEIASVLNDLIPCYTYSPPDFLNCDHNLKGRVDLIFIEGHTDAVPLGPKLRKLYNDNLELSTRRANYTYRIMVENYDSLSRMKNSSNYPIFSVSGYGENRPVPIKGKEESVNDSANRRIDIRFLMAIPKI